MNLRIAIVGRRKSSMFEAKSDSGGINRQCRDRWRNWHLGGTDRTDKRGFCQFCRLPMMLVGGERNGTFKNCQGDVSTCTSDSDFDFPPAIFVRRRPTSGPNLRKTAGNANTKPKRRKELELMISTMRSYRCHNGL